MAGTCALLGAWADGRVWLEAFDEVTDAYQQMIVSLEGGILQTSDGRLFPDAAGLIAPGNLTLDDDLTVRGARHRGLRSEDRIDDLVQPLTMAEKMMLVERLRLDVLPPQVIGLAESHVLARATTTQDDTVMVCRRLRIAYAMSQAKQDTDGQPYNYDTHSLHIAHFYNVQSFQPDSLTDIWDHLPVDNLVTPVDCCRAELFLFVAEAGGVQQESRVHVFCFE